MSQNTRPPAPLAGSSKGSPRRARPAPPRPDAWAARSLIGLADEITLLRLRLRDAATTHDTGALNRILSNLARALTAQDRLDPASKTLDDMWAAAAEEFLSEPPDAPDDGTSHPYDRFSGRDD